MNELVHSILSNPDFGAALATLVTVILTAVIGFVGQAVREKVKATLSAEQIRMLQTIASIAVQTAEQTGAMKAAAEKKAAALAIVQAYIDATGLKVSAAQIDAAIEASVFDQFNASWAKPATLEVAAPITGA